MNLEVPERLLVFGGLAFTTIVIFGISFIDDGSDEQQQVSPCLDSEFVGAYNPLVLWNDTYATPHMRL